MAKKASKLLKKAIKKDIKIAKKGSKRLSKQLFGKNGLTLSHSFENTVTFFTGGNESKPLYTVSRNGSYQVSVLKLIIVALAVISGAVLLGLAIKAIIDRAAPKKNDEYDDDLELLDTDELPF